MCNNTRTLGGEYKFYLIYRSYRAVEFIKFAFV